MMQPRTIRQWLTLAVGVLCLALPGRAAAAILQAGNASGQPGQALQVALSLGREAGEQVASLQCDLFFNAATLGFNGAVPTENLNAACKTLQANELAPGHWRIIVLGFNQLQIPAGMLALLGFQILPAAPPGPCPVQLGSVVMSNPAAQPIPASGVGGVITVLPLVFHSADSNTNQVIDLTELLRGIQIYNAGQYWCDASTEDGYTIIPAQRECTPHDSDYRNGADWRISLTEMLRLIQFFNVGGYVASDSTEDGYEARAKRHG